MYEIGGRGKVTNWWGLFGGIPIQGPGNAGTYENRQNKSEELNTSDNVKVLYTNVQSLTSGTKREELQVLIETENVDVVGLTETWGKSEILDSEMEIPGGEWVSSFLTAHQHIIGYISALQWCEYCDKVWKYNQWFSR